MIEWFPLLLGKWILSLLWLSILLILCSSNFYFINLVLCMVCWNISFNLVPCVWVLRQIKVFRISLNCEKICPDLQCEYRKRWWLVFLIFLNFLVTLIFCMAYTGVYRMHLFSLNKWFCWIMKNPYYPLFSIFAHFKTL